MLPFEEGFMTHHIETKNDISNSVKKFCCPVEKYRIQYIIFDTFVRWDNLYTCREKTGTLHWLKIVDVTIQLDKFMPTC